MFQFRISALIIVTFIVAVTVWLLFVIPSDIGVMVMCAVYVMLPGIVAAGIVYHRNAGRAFFIGMAPIVLMSFFQVITSYPFGRLDYLFSSRGNVDEQRLTMMIPIALALVGGLFAVLVRFWAQRVQAKRNPLE